MHGMILNTVSTQPRYHLRYLGERKTLPGRVSLSIVLSVTVAHCSLFMVCLQATKYYEGAVDLDTKMFEKN